MIYGIGIDIQKISQIDEIFARQKERFLQKIFTEQEIAYCSKYKNCGERYAARWAVKEAFFKAMATGIGGGYRFTDVEIINLASGKPHIVLYGKALEDCKRLGLKVFVSISHSDEYAVGQIILTAADEDDN